VTLPPRNRRPLAVSISERHTKHGTRHTLRITNPVTKKRLNFGDFDERWEAETEAQRVFHEYESGAPLESLLPTAPPAKATTQGDTVLGDFIDQVYLPSLNVTLNTKRDYQVACKHIRNYEYAKGEFFENKPLNAFTSNNIRTFIAAFKTAPNGTQRSNNYTRKVAQRVRHVFTMAVADGYIKAEQHPYRSGMGKVNQLPSRPALDTVCALDHKAVNTMLRLLKTEAAKDTDWSAEADYWYHLILAALWSGLRVSELLGLQFDDLLTNTFYLNVDTQWAWKAKSDTRFVPPKSKTSVRTVPMDEGIFQELFDWKRKVRKQGTPDELLFPRLLADGEWGYWGSASHFHKKYAKMQEKVWTLYQEECAKQQWTEPVPKTHMLQNFHEFRHLYASICLSELKLDPNSVSKWLGHYSVAFTYEVYSGLIKGVHDAAAMKMRNAGKPEQVDILTSE
jgi:integrase